MTVIVDGYATNYTIEGNGPVIVFLHGWGDTLKTFDSIATALRKDYTVVRVDLLGFGGSDNPRETFSLDSYAAFIAHFLMKIGIDDKIYALVGHSNGGAIIVRGVATKNLSANKLILLASAGVRSTYNARKKALRMAAKTVKLPTALLPRQTRDKLKKRAYSAIGSDLFVAEHLQDTFKTIVTDDVLNDASKISLPTLLLYGKEDAATPPLYGELFHNAMKNSKLVIVGHAGHFIHHESKETVLKEMREFLS